MSIWCCWRCHSYMIEPTSNQYLPHIFQPHLTNHTESRCELRGFAFAKMPLFGRLRVTLRDGGSDTWSISGGTKWKEMPHPDSSIEKKTFRKKKHQSILIDPKNSLIIALSLYCKDRLLHSVRVPVPVIPDHPSLLPPRPTAGPEPLGEIPSPVSPVSQGSQGSHRAAWCSWCGSSQGQGLSSQHGKKWINMDQC